MSDQPPPQDLLDWLGISKSPNWRVAKPLGYVVAVLLTLLILIALAAAFALLGNTIFSGTVNGAGSLSAGALIVAILGAPFLVWSTVIKQKTVDFQKESHITDRISKAVEHLGAEKTVKRLNDQGQTVETTEPNIEVRIGGLLSLERIAQDSTRYDKGRDHVRVMEILCAYVRENAPAEDALESPFPDECHEGTIDQKEKTRPYDWIISQDSPRSDIQIALFIIGRRSKKQREIEASYSGPNGTPYTLDLSKTNLRKANFEGLNFAHASFFKSLLEGAYCKEADFSHTNLIYAQMTCANGRGMILEKAKMDSADLSWAYLHNARITHCSISHTHFIRTQLKGAHIIFREKEAPNRVNRAFFVDADLSETLIEGDTRQVHFTFNLLPDELYPRELRAAALRNCILVDGRSIWGHPHFQSTFNSDELAVPFGDASNDFKEAQERPKHWPDWSLPSDGPNGFHTQWKLWQADPDGYIPPPKPTD